MSGGRLRGEHQPGDYRTICDFCGVVWLRSQLVMDADRRLRCPDDLEGRSLVELARDDIDRARRVPPRRGGGVPVEPPADAPYTHRTTRDEWPS